MNQTDLEKLRIGSGIITTTDNQDYYFVIIDIQKHVISCYPVREQTQFQKYYNDTNVSTEEQHNIPLTDSPPPFSELYAKTYCYVNLADKKTVSTIELLDAYQLSDNGQTVSKHDLKLIFDHDLQQQQLEKRRNRPLAKEPSEQEEYDNEYTY